MVSSGNLTKSSMREVKNEVIEYAPGVWIGSIRNHCRKTIGSECPIKVGIELWRIVMGKISGGQDIDGRALSDGRIARGVDVDVVNSSLQTC